MRYLKSGPVRCYGQREPKEVEDAKETENSTYEVRRNTTERVLSRSEATREYCVSSRNLMQRKEETHGGCIGNLFVNDER